MQFQYFTIILIINFLNQRGDVGHNKKNTGDIKHAAVEKTKKLSAPMKILPQQVWPKINQFVLVL